MPIQGIQYLVDESGVKTAVVIDLKRHRRLWEDLYDRLLIESRRDEPRESLEQVRAALSREEKRHA